MPKIFNARDFFLLAVHSGMDLCAGAWRIHLAANYCSHLQRFDSVVPDLSGSIFLNMDDLCGQLRATARGGDEAASCRRNIALWRGACGSKSRAIQRHAPERLAIGVGKLLNIGDDGIKARQQRVDLVEAFGHGCIFKWKIAATSSA